MLAFIFGFNRPSPNMDLGHGAKRTSIVGLTATIKVTIILRKVFALD
jgi:hypothetical protein